MNIGIDPGFSSTIVALESGKAVILPSIVGTGQSDYGLLGDGMAVPAGTLRRTATRPDMTAFDGMRFLVGEHVAEYGKVLESRMDFQRLGDSPELRALIYTALYRLLGTGHHTELRLMVGLPVEVMKNKALGQEIRANLQGWLLGAHEATVSGEPIRLGVTHVEVTAQPAGSYFAWGMDGAGQWIRGQEALREQVAVWDLGFNTLDRYVLQGGQVVHAYTGGERAGMRRAAEVLIQSVREAHQVHLTLHQADALLREECPRLATAGQMVDLGPLVRQAREAVIAAVLGPTDEQWGNARQFYQVILTGGGAIALRDVLREHYPHGVTLPNPVAANAVGLARYGKLAIR